MPTLELSEMGLSVLGAVPVGLGLFHRGTGSSIAEVNSDEAEAYRRVQGSLLFSLDQSDKSMVLVAGTRKNPHSATTVAANLAAAPPGRAGAPSWSAPTCVARACTIGSASTTTPG